MAALPNTQVHNVLEVAGKSVSTRAGSITARCITASRTSSDSFQELGTAVSNPISKTVKTARTGSIVRHEAISKADRQDTTDK